MQYRPKKKPFAALFAVGVFASAAASLLTFMLFGIGKRYLLLAAALFFFAIAFLFISRFIVFDCVYRLDKDYSHPFLALYLLKKNKSYLVEKIPLEGKETLVLLNRKGKKQIKNRTLVRDMTSNLVPSYRYALLFEQETKPCYLLLELDDEFANEIKAFLYLRILSAI